MMITNLLISIKKEYLLLVNYLKYNKKNLNIIRPKNETEDLLVSVTKNCETLIKQNITKSQEVLEFKINRSKQTFQFNPPILIE